MKRSDAILKICNELENSICPSGLMGDIAFDEVAEMVLYELTKSGMLPPSYSACILTHKPKERGELLIHQWEPEDD